MYQILIIDADEENRIHLSTEFKKNGYEVFETDSADQGLDIIKTKAISLVILDYDISSKERTQFFHFIQTSEQYKDLPIFLVGSVSTLSREKAYSHGAVATVRRPFNLNSLFTQVKKHLHSPMERLLTLQSAQSADDSKLPAIESSHISVKNLGKGGFSVRIATAASFIEGQKVQFDLPIENSGNTPLKGIGVVRYISSSQNNQSERGIGIEFESLEKTSLATFAQEVEKSKPKAYVPGSFHS